jgi:sigma-B regulation protein RsbU (phosphoserine phosphatase)
MEEQGGLYFTIAYGILDLESRLFRFASGGHTPLVLLSPNGEIRRFDADGMAVGWMDDIEYTDVVQTLRPGDRVYLVSDGIPEAMDPELNEFGDVRMHEAIAGSRQQPLPDAAETLLQTVLQWCNPTGPRDDVSILAFEVPG